MINLRVIQTLSLAVLLVVGSWSFSLGAQCTNVRIAATSSPATTPGKDTNPAVETNGIYTVSGPVLPPKLIQCSEPEYTQQAAEFHIVGDSTISLIVGVDGKPQDVIAVKKLGLGLDENAVKSVQNFRFQPATLNGKHVPVSIQLVVGFDRCEDAADCAQMAAEVAKDQAEESQSLSKTDTSKPVERDGIYKVGGSVLPPKLIKQHSPKYTKEAKRAHTKGMCVLSVVIDAQGQPQNIQVTQSIGMGLDENAVAAVK